MDLRRTRLGPRLQHCRLARAAAHGPPRFPLRQAFHGAPILIALTLPPPDLLRPRLACQLRVAGVGLHLAAGLLTAATVYPFAGQALRQRLKQRWSQKLLTILGIRLRLSGDLQAGALLVANHVSWIDIFVINAAAPTGFVSKAEVRGWPLIGWLAEKTDTLFIERGRRQHVQHIAHQMATRLTAGQSVAFFPEGTTTDGSELLPFHAGLFQPAIAAGVPVQPLTIRYVGPDGRRSTAPAYAGETSFMACLWATVSSHGLVAELDGLPLQQTQEAGRRDLARAATTAIQERLGLASQAIGTRG